MTKAVYVIGHRNPDSDSICAAIAYSALKRTQGIEAIPCRAGEINRETRFILDYFKVKDPLYLADIHTRAKDLLNGNGLETALPGMPVWEAWQLMRARGIKTLPVTDESGHLLGLVTVGDFADKYLADLGEQDLGTISSTVKNVLQTLSGRLVAGDIDRKLKGAGVIGAMHSETMNRYLRPGNIVIVGDREEVQRASLEAGVACLIITGGCEPGESIVRLASTADAAIICVQMDTFTAARMLLMSIPVESIMHTRDLIVFDDDDLLDEVKKVMLNTRFRNYPVVDDQNRVLGEISRYHLLGFARKRVILVDHNEFSQSVDGMDEAQIVEIIDHHRVGGIQTGDPILFRNEPVGSTCTLVAKAYLEAGVTPGAEIAGLLCAGILSDTVIFKSPTCTAVDKDMAAYLGKIAGIDPTQFGVAMFKHGTSLLGRTPEDILGADFKKFAMGEVTIGIGQVGIMGGEGIGQIKEELMREMDRVRIGENLEYVLLMVTDLLSEDTHLLINGPKAQIIGDAFSTKVEQGEALLKGVLSRKKQVVPPLIKYFQQS